MQYIPRTRGEHWMSFRCHIGCAASMATEGDVALIDGRLAMRGIAAGPDWGTRNAHHGNAPQLFTDPGSRLFRFPGPLIVTGLY